MMRDKKKNPNTKDSCNSDGRQFVLHVAGKYLKLSFFSIYCQRRKRIKEATRRGKDHKNEQTHNTQFTSLRT